MKLLHFGIWSALGLAVVMPNAAAAMDGFASVTLNEYAGPSTEYPLVSTIPAGASVTIYGCLVDWDWCDIQYYGDRGWVLAAYLETRPLTDERERRIPLFQLYPLLVHTVLFGGTYRHQAETACRRLT